MSEDSRISSRRHLFYYLEARDRSTGETVGRLGDIHDEGLLLLTPVALGLGTRIGISLVLPPALGEGRDKLDLDIEVKWSRRDGRDTRFQNGCGYTSIGDGDRDFITALVERIGFSDGQRKILLKNDSNIFIEPGRQE